MTGHAKLPGLGNSSTGGQEQQGSRQQRSAPHAALDRLAAGGLPPDMREDRTPSVAPIRAATG